MQPLFTEREKVRNVKIISLLLLPGAAPGWRCCFRNLWFCYASASAAAALLCLAAVFAFAGIFGLFFVFVFVFFDFMALDIDFAAVVP